jgi:predicted nucleic acid-binding protein
MSERIKDALRNYVAMDRANASPVVAAEQLGIREISSIDSDF